MHFLLFPHFRGLTGRISACGTSIPEKWRRRFNSAQFRSLTDTCVHQGLNLGRIHHGLRERERERERRRERERGERERSLVQLL